MTQPIPRSRPPSSEIEPRSPARASSANLPGAAVPGKTPGTAVIPRAVVERERKRTAHALLHPVLVAAMLLTLVFPVAAWVGVYDLKHQRRSDLREYQLTVDRQLQQIESALSNGSMTALRKDETVVAASADALDDGYCRNEADTYGALERALSVGVLALGNYRRNDDAPTIDPAQVDVQVGAYRVVDASLTRAHGGQAFGTAAEGEFVVVGDYVGCAAFLHDFESFFERHFRYLEVVLPYARDDARGVYSMLVRIHVPVLTGTLNDDRLDALLDR